MLKGNKFWIFEGFAKDIINKVNNQIKTKFAFKGPNVLKLFKVKNYGKTKSKYIGSLNKLQNIYRLKDSDELSLYHQHFWLEYIMNGATSSDFSNIPDNVLYPLMKRWAFSDKSYKMTEINKLKDDHPEFVDWVKTTEKLDHKKMLKDITQKSNNPELEKNPVYQQLNRQTDTNQFVAGKKIDAKTRRRMNAPENQFNSYDPLKEEAPTNNVGGGQIAGTAEAGDDPPVKKGRKKKKGKKKRYIYGGTGSRRMWMKKNNK